MEKFLIYIDKYKWAIFGTVIIHIIIFATAKLTTVERPIKYEEETVEAKIEEIDLDDFEIDKKDDQFDPDGNVTNAVVNMNDDRKMSNHFSKSSADEDVWNKTKNFEEAYRRELESKHKPHESKYDYTDDKGVNLGNNDNSNSSNTNTKPPGNVLVRVDLGSRKELSVPKPGYLCPGSGKVVIKIKVDKSGKVTEANPIPSMSRNATQCMYRVASKYAKKSRFGYQSAGGVQEGKIYYTFVGQ